MFDDQWNQCIFVAVACRFQTLMTFKVCRTAKEAARVTGVTGLHGVTSLHGAGNLPPPMAFAFQIAINKLQWPLKEQACQAFMRKVYDSTTKIAFSIKSTARPAESVCQMNYWPHAMRLMSVVWCMLFQLHAILNWSFWPWDCLPAGMPAACVHFSPHIFVQINDMIPNDTKSQPAHSLQPRIPLQASMRSVWVLLCIRNRGQMLQDLGYWTRIVPL